jgi:hypothetical protein
MNNGITLRCVVGTWRHTGSERDYVKPLDSNDGALVAARFEPDEGSNAQAELSVPDSDADVLTPRARSEIVAAAADVARAKPSGAARFSRIVPLGTSDDRTPSMFESSGPAATHDSDVVPRGSEAREAVAAGTGGPVLNGAIIAVPIIVGPAADSAPVGGSIVDGPSQSHRDAPRADPRALRSAAHVGAFAITRVGPGLDPDDDDEATTVDAGAALTDDERAALARRIHSVMEETLPHGTPLPEPVRPFDAPEPAHDRRGPFKRTMLLGLPKVGPPASLAAAVPAMSVPDPAMPSAPDPAMSSASDPAMSVPDPAMSVPDLAMSSAAPLAPTFSASGAAEPALLASVVRVVGPPKHPPPRRSRRVPSFASDEPSEPDHEAFVLTHAIVTPDRAKPSAVAPPLRRTVESLPGSVDAPQTSAPNPVAVTAGRSLLPGVILPPAPRAEDFDPPSSPVPAVPVATAPVSAARISASSISVSSMSVAPPAPLLRATIEPPASLSRTRPPVSQRFVPDPQLEELPASDPFAGFVAPPPSLAQRWLVVVVVALAVVGLCSIAAIALGFLGKTGW